jgi:hypothetical protein
VSAHAPTLAERMAAGLSATLPFPRRPDTCQACGLVANALAQGDLTVWVECDPWDRATTPPVYVVLCRRCSTRLIDPHPRLYMGRDVRAPNLGAMALCTDCALRSGLDCGAALARQNGGAGMAITYATAPVFAHVSVSPRSASGFRTLYREPPTACDGYEALP